MIRMKALWAVSILGIIFTLSGCGYLENKEDLAKWVKESMQTEMQKDGAYKDLSIDNVVLVRESSNKFTGYVEFKYGADTEKANLTVTVDGNQKIYQCDPPRALILKRSLGQLGNLFNNTTTTPDLEKVPVSNNGEFNPKLILDKFYSEYDKNNDCWVANDEGQRYCMKIDRKDKISVADVQRIYMLLTGVAIDDKGEMNGSHASSGLAGAFVFEVRNGNAETVASNPKIQVGASGSAPTKWNFIKIGPSDNWGWQNIWGDCHQGYCGSRYSILTPNGKDIRDTAGFTASYSDGGTCTKECTTIESKLEVDDTKISEKIFPLLITVTGEENGKKLDPKKWTVSFDSKKWSYVEPQQWPLSGKDF